MAGSKYRNNTGQLPSSSETPNDDDNLQENEELDEEEEYEALDQKLDQLNSCLDVLEQQNDVLHAQLCSLLESSRQTRREFQEQNGKEPEMPQLVPNQAEK